MNTKNTNKRNYQKELDAITEKLKGRPKLLMHSCCAPCSSYCMEYLCQFFDITIYYYNPNITDPVEYKHRVSEQQRLIKELSEEAMVHISFEEGTYDVESFINISKGLEDCPEGGERCEKCFRLRLSMAAKYAAKHDYDYFTTTLTISPLKNADLLNVIGEEQAKLSGVQFLPSDFKKKNGYKRSVELSEKYGLYRQNYCGCVYSKREMEKRNEKND